jgi:hypothetical protein
MRSSITRWIALSLALVLLGVVAFTAVRAQTGNGFDLSWWTADGGGGTSQGGGYTLSGTAGQADAGVLSGGDYTLSGGFWGGLAEAPELIPQSFIPLVLKEGS